MSAFGSLLGVSGGPSSARTGDTYVNVDTAAVQGLNSLDTFTQANGGSIFNGGLPVTNTLAFANQQPTPLPAAKPAGNNTFLWFAIGVGGLLVLYISSKA